jgi:hypothetical protein
MQGMGRLVIALSVVEGDEAVWCVVQWFRRRTLLSSLTTCDHIDCIVPDDAHATGIGVNYHSNALLHTHMSHL